MLCLCFICLVILFHLLDVVFFLYAAVHLRAKVFRNDYVVAWCFIYIGFEALAKPKHNHKYQFSLHKQSECVRYIASVHTHFVCVYVFFSSSHFEWNEQNERKKKSNVRTAYWLLHILLFLCSSRMLFVGWSIGRSAYPIYYFLFIHIHTDMLFITMWTEHDCLGVLCICTLPQVNKFHIYINRKKHLKNRSKFIHFISNSFLYIARSFVPIDSNRHFQSSIYRYWFDAIAFGSLSVCVCAVFYSPFGCLFVSIFFHVCIAFHLPSLGKQNISLYLIPICGWNKKEIITKGNCAFDITYIAR